MRYLLERMRPDGHFPTTGMTDRRICGPYRTTRNLLRFAVRPFANGAPVMITALAPQQTGGQDRVIGFYLPQLDAIHRRIAWTGQGANAIPCTSGHTALHVWESAKSDGF